MVVDVPLACTCGAMGGMARRVSARTGNRIVCMCDDCQSYAHFLGRADTLLDAHGGTELFQLPPGRLELSRGQEHLRCVRLTPKGMMRWYAGCCSTPIGCTLARPGVPFVGVAHLFIHDEGLGWTRDEIFGPVLARIHGRFSKGPMPKDAYPGDSVGSTLRTLLLLLLGWVRREHTPSPFFDDVGAPRATPSLLTLQEPPDLPSTSPAPPASPPPAARTVRGGVVPDKTQAPPGP